ncbi:MAG: lysophospholipid acyltransferase family protein [Acidimicrobiia bacterium]|nr:MAG: lysophospholipid acyltransferase family protein [Acidimicrobiia bacterium]
MRRVRDWFFSIPTVIAFGLTLIFFDITGRIALLFGLRQFEWAMAGLQRTLLGVFAISGVRFDIEGLDGFGTSGGYIFVSNHQSMYDIPIFGGILVRNFPKYVAKRSLASGIPSISLNLSRGGNALIDRGDKAQAVAAISQMATECQDRDVSAVIFPEGTRSRDGSIGSYRPAGVAALMAGAPDLPVIPTVIDGSWKVFAHNMLPIPFGTRVRVRFGDPIERSENEDPSAIVEQCHTWASGVLDSWNQSSGTSA